MIAFMHPHLRGLLAGSSLFGLPLCILFRSQNFFYLFLFSFCGFLLYIFNILFFVHHRTFPHIVGKVSFAHYRRGGSPPPPGGAPLISLNIPPPTWAAPRLSCPASHWRTLFAGVLHSFEMFFLLFQIQLIDFLVLLFCQLK